MTLKSPESQERPGQGRRADYPFKGRGGRAIEAGEVGWEPVRGAAHSIGADDK